jgi:hypothetical protein
VKHAQHVICKLEGPLASLKALMSKESFPLVAPSIKDPLTAVFLKLSQTVSQAEGVVNSGCGVVDADVKTLAVDLGIIRANSQLAQGMIALIERSGRARQ